MWGVEPPPPVSGWGWSYKRGLLPMVLQHRSQAQPSAPFVATAATVLVAGWLGSMSMQARYLHGEELARLMDGEPVPDDWLPLYKAKQVFERGTLWEYG